MKCPNCNSNLIWGGDHSYEDYGVDGDGIVGNYTCSNNKCDVEDVYIYTRL
jgi:hypothetical protein